MTLSGVAGSSGPVYSPSSCTVWGCMRVWLGWRVSSRGSWSCRLGCPSRRSGRLYVMCERIVDRFRAFVALLTLTIRTLTILTHITHARTHIIRRTHARTSSDARTHAHHQTHPRTHIIRRTHARTSSDARTHAHHQTHARTHMLRSPPPTRGWPLSPTSSTLSLLRNLPIAPTWRTDSRREVIVMAMVVIVVVLIIIVVVVVALAAG
jgi:hypothetical protein